MGRKVDAQLIKLEHRIARLEQTVEDTRGDVFNFVEASKADWKYLREYCNQKIEGK